MKYKNDIPATRIMLSILIIVLTVAFFYYVEVNPVRLYDYRRDMERYLAEKYKEHDFYIDNLRFNNQDKYFVARVKLKSHSDRNFKIIIYSKKRFKELDISEQKGLRLYGNGYVSEKDEIIIYGNEYIYDKSVFKLYDNEYIYDNYKDTVLSGYNTFYRISGEYKKFVKDSIRNRFSMPVQEVTGWLSGEDSRKEAERLSPNRIIADELIPDKKYDVRELGKENGTISISFVSSREETPELLAKMLLEVKDYCNREKIYFYEIYLDINDGDCQVDAFRYEDIYEEGLVDRVKKNMETAW